MRRKGQRPGHAGEEMVSLNEPLFSLDAGNLTVEELDRRLELAVAHASFVCDTFVCGSFATCSAFGCGAFKFNQTG